MEKFSIFSRSQYVGYHTSVHKQERRGKSYFWQFLEIPPASVSNNFWLPWLSALGRVSRAFFISQLWHANWVWRKEEQPLFTSSDLERGDATSGNGDMGGGKEMVWHTQAWSSWKRKYLHINFLFFFPSGPTQPNCYCQTQSFRDCEIALRKPWHRNDWLCWALLVFRFQVLCFLLSQQEMQLKGGGKALYEAWRCLQRRGAGS